MHPESGYHQENIVRALSSVGLKRRDCVFTHSNIGFFGQCVDAVSYSDYYRVFKDALFSIIGEEGTWVTPTFTYSFCRKETYDPRETPGVCGYLSESMRRDPKAQRSDDANFSIAAVGGQAQDLASRAPEYSFGDGTFWERFLQMDGKICNFNFDSGSTFIHYVECQLRVAYRYHKAFPGILQKNGQAHKKTFYHFVYDYSRPTTAPDFTKFDRHVRSRNIARIAPIGKGQIVAIDAQDVYKIIEAELKKDPSFLILGT